MKSIPLDNDWEYIWPGTRKNASTGQDEPAAGLVGLQARLSLTSGGATIHTDLTKSMAERASKPGEYFAVVDGDTLRTHLVALIGQTIYEVFGDGTNVLYSTPRRIVESRSA